MLILRDMIESDIEDYVNWFTTETEWGDWDAPWEPFEDDKDSARRQWTQIYNSLCDYPSDKEKYRFEIELDGNHIGWVGSYRDLGYIENKENIPVIGITIPSLSHRRNGNGTNALLLFADYWKNLGYSKLYTQTWAGNYPMIKLAQKLGFKEFYRKKDYRTVNGQKYDAVTFLIELEDISQI